MEQRASDQARSPPKANHIGELTLPLFVDLRSPLIALPPVVSHLKPMTLSMKAISRKGSHICYIVVQGLPRPPCHKRHRWDTWCREPNEVALLAVLFDPPTKNMQ